jgi:hypothetical protein
MSSAHPTRNAFYLIAGVIAVAKEEGCNLEPSKEADPANVLLQQLASTEAVVWSPQTDSASVQALSDLLVAAREASNA